MYKIIRIVIMLVSLVLGSIASTKAATITIAPDTPYAGGNCFPFGLGGSYDTPPAQFTWKPYMGFVYQNVPSFSLQPGDIIAFDLRLQNDADIQLDIAMARTTVNGGDVPAEPFTTVVYNTQTPLNPRGDTTVGNFELQFTVQESYSFPGGGLIVRFSNPSSTFANDNTCTQVMVHTSSGDTSNYFVERFIKDADGLYPPWNNIYTDGYIAGIRIITQDQAQEIPTMTEWGMIIFVVFAGVGAVYYLRRQKTAKS